MKGIKDKKWKAKFRIGLITMQVIFIDLNLSGLKRKKSMTLQIVAGD